MEYAAIALATLGFSVGAIFRLKMLLSVVAVLLVGSIVFSLVNNFSVLKTTLTIVITQSSFQGGYFLAIVARAVFASTQ
jgi:hypothetical protein